ncbi:hypothetical protein AB0F71_25940 [Kitasatospora sp. NPDC028055]|uniref:hypothetical protein n=1 Tax=Kitasatospora sp. NPDC028055 TaxID=3155653 RepID=UPI00340AA770
MTVLDRLLAGLPEAFSTAPRPSRIDGCPCCASRAGLDRLLRTPREQLTPGELGPYAASVLNTVGAPADLRYFLPRILQLVLTSELARPELPLVGRKLAQAGWQDWPEAPYLRRLLDALWLDVLHDAGQWWDADAVLCALGAADPDGTGGRLAEWARFADPVAVERLYEFALGGELEPRDAFWDEQGAAYRTFAAWLRGPELQLAVEAAFLRTDDPTQLDQLITVHDILAA